MDKEGITTGEVLLGYSPVPDSLENPFHVAFLSVGLWCISAFSRKCCRGFRASGVAEEQADSEVLVLQVWVGVCLAAG